jgi:hypothetical protein
MCEQMCGEFIALFCMLIVGCPVEICCGFPQLSKVNCEFVQCTNIPGPSDCSVPHSLFGALFINLLLLIQWIHSHYETKITLFNTQNVMETRLAKLYYFEAAEF